MGRLKYIAKVMIGKINDPSIPIATYWLIFANCLMWYLEVLFKKIPYYLAMSNYSAPYEVWRYLTSAFLHNPENPIHLLSNMFSLYIAGTIVERFLGVKKYLVSYFAIIISSNVVSTLFSFILMNETTYSFSMGASGVIMGLFAILIFLFKRIHFPSNQIIFVVAINLLMPLFVRGIDLFAHLFGFLMGLLIAFALGLLDKTAYEIKEKLFWTVIISMVALSIIINVIIILFYGDFLGYINNYINY